VTNHLRVECSQCAYLKRLLTRYDPILVENNPHRRTGTKRCKQCRRWRLKVFPVQNSLDVNVFDDPCVVFSKKGLVCRRKGKVWDARRHCGDIEMSENERSMSSSMGLGTFAQFIPHSPQFLTIWSALPMMHFASINLFLSRTTEGSLRIKSGSPCLLKPSRPFTTCASLN
jgi:hypothetical protein